MNKIITVCAIMLVLFTSSSLFGEDTLIVPKTENPPVIDGKIDESTWTEALKFDNFKTINPDYGKEPSQKTVAYMTYDSENIYFAIRSFDLEPTKIKSSVSSRDGMFQDDYIAIMLDTFGTMQEAFGFFLNPQGIQGDGMINADGNAEAVVGECDKAIDGVGEIDGPRPADGEVVRGQAERRGIAAPIKLDLSVVPHDLGLAG